MLTNKQKTSTWNSSPGSQTNPSRPDLDPFNIALEAAIADHRELTGATTLGDGWPISLCVSAEGSSETSMQCDFFIRDLPIIRAMTGKRLDDLSMDVDSAYLALHEAIRGQGWRQHFILVAFLAVYLVDLRIGDVGVTWNQITRVELNLEEIDGRLETKASFFWVMTNPMELPAGSGAAISYEEVKP